MKRYRWWALAAMVLAVLTIGFDVTILNVALPTLAADIRASTSELQWIVDAYLLVFAGLLLPAGAVGDRYGRRMLMLVGLALFGLASVAAALITEPAQLIAVRAVMGIGAAILTPVSLAVVPVLFPAAADRRKALAAVTVGGGIGLPLGPLVGGYLLDHFWWGSIFLVNVPVTAVAMVAVAALVPESRDPSARPIDVPGAVLSTAGLAALVFGIIEGPARGWGDTAVVAAVSAGAIVLAVFVAVQARARYPMVDLDLFRSRRFVWGAASATVASFALFGLLFVLPQYLQEVRGNDALGTGVRLLPMMAGLLVAGKASEKAVAEFGNRVTAVAGLLVAAAGLGWAATTGAGTGYAEVAGWLAMIGFGSSVAMIAGIDAILGSLPPARAGTGTGLQQAMRQVGGALGVAVLGSVLADTYVDHLPAGAPQAARESIAGAVATATRLGDPALLAAGRQAYLEAMSADLLLCAAISVAGAVLIGLMLPGRAPAEPAEEQSGHELTRLT